MANLLKYIGIGALTLSLNGCDGGFIGPSRNQFMLDSQRIKNEAILEEERIKRGYQMQEADLDGNGISDKFYVINKNIAIFEMNGKPAVQYFKSKDKEKK